jgi:hypothetical protein
MHHVPVAQVWKTFFPYRHVVKLLEPEHDIWPVEEHVADEEISE